MNGACNVKRFFGPAPWGPGEGSKGQISFNFNYKVNFNDFYTRLCVCSHKWKTENISDGILILSPGSCSWDGTLGRWGVIRGYIFFFKHGHVVYQIDGDDKQNRMQVNFHPRVKLVTLGRGQRSNIIKFRLPCQFQRFLYQILCVFSQVKDTKYIGWDFYSVAWVMRPGVGLWGTGGNQGVKQFFFQTWSCSISN